MCSANIKVNSAPGQSAFGPTRRPGCDRSIVGPDSQRDSSSAPAPSRRPGSTHLQAARPRDREAGRDIKGVVPALFGSALRFDPAGRLCSAAPVLLLRHYHHGGITVQAQGCRDGAHPGPNGASRPRRPCTAHRGMIGSLPSFSPALDSAPTPTLTPSLLGCSPSLPPSSSLTVTLRRRRDETASLIPDWRSSACPGGWLRPCSVRPTVCAPLTFLMGSRWLLRFSQAVHSHGGVPH